MSPKAGRPTSDPKTIHVGYRLSKDDAKRLQECCEVLNMSKTDVIRHGIELVHKEATEARQKNK